MLVRIERNSAIPVSRQMADQMRAQCLSGRIAPGTQLPSVRRLAEDLAVNQNTVLRVYEQLAAEGLLQMRHGAGTYVADKLPLRRIKREHIRFVDEWHQLVLRGRLLGLERAELHTLLDEAVTQTGRL